MKKESVGEASARVDKARSYQARIIIKRGSYGVLAALLLSAMVGAFMPRPVAVELAVVTRGPLQVTVDEDGQARIKDRYVISAPLAGSLARIGLEPGDSIKQGQVLVRIEPVSPALLDSRARATATARLAQALAARKQAQVQVERAKTTSEFATSEAARAQNLFSSGAGTQQQLDQTGIDERRAVQEYKSLRFAARVAEFEVEMARAALDRLPGSPGGAAQLDVPSPISGRVLKVLHKSEGVVEPGVPLLEVGDPQALEVVIDVLTSDAARIRPGAHVVLDGWGGEVLEGRVRRIEPSAFTRLSAFGVEEQRVNLLADLLTSHEHFRALGDGYRVEAHVVVWEGTALKVPQSALFRQESGWALFRFEHGMARLTPVELGERTAHEAAVLHGLSAGDRVIVHPGDAIADGVKVAAQ